MTVSSTTSKVSYSGNGSTVAFTVTFYFLASSDIKVLVRSANGTEVVKTLGTDYTVTGAGDPAGGTVTFGTAPISGQTVVLARSVPLTQVTDYTPNDPFPAETHERALDKLTQVTQQINEAVNRSLKLSLSNTMTSTEFTVDAATRANKVLGFDAAGELVVSQELGTYRGNWTSGTAYKQRDIIKDTSNANIYICITAHTASGSQPISSNTDVAKWALLVDAASAAAAEAAAEAAQAAAEAAQAAAETAEANAETAETNAETAETNAETAATNASNSASAAATSATNSANSATASASSASAASTSATNASNSASAASTSATNASNSATAASGSASTASTQATNAANSASAASTSATNASNSASAASTSATNASNSASAASTSASNAATSASAADASAVAAASSAASAASSYDQFDDRYLGSKTSAPATDNDGNALVVGALYYNSTTGKMNVYDGGTWIEASAASQAILVVYQYTATGGQTTFSGTDNNSLTLGYTVGSAIVTLNGVVLEIPSEATASSGTSVVLASGATAGDELNVYAFSTFNLADVYTKAQSDARYPQIDTNTLFVDTVNDRVGVGTSSPLAKLHIEGSSSGAVQAFIENANGSTNSSAELVFGTWSGAIPTGTGNPGPSAKISAINMASADARTDLVFSTYASSGSSAERMRIDSSGRVTKPFQPAFSQMGAGSGSLSSGNIIQFGISASAQVNFDVGSNWNSSTDRFTAPVSGTYLFMCSVYVQNGNTQDQPVAPCVNGSQLSSTTDTFMLYQGRITGADNAVMGSFILKLSANDYVDLRVRLGGYSFTYYAGHSWFQGYLLG
jgi:hypothetical protein